MDELQELKAEIKRLNDRFEIVELFHRYAAAMDTLDREELKTIFTEDAIQDHGATRDRDPYFNGTWNGIDEILERMNVGMGRHLITHHAVTNHRVTIDGDHATATAYLHSVHADAARGTVPTVQ